MDVEAPRVCGAGNRVSGRGVPHGPPPPPAVREPQRHFQDGLEGPGTALTAQLLHPPGGGAPHPLPKTIQSSPGTHVIWEGVGPENV